MQKWNLTKPYQMVVHTDGVYSAFTSSGKTIKSYCKNSEEAFIKSLNSISREDKIIAVWKSNG